jgi:YfiR/HmsC-like
VAKTHCPLIRAIRRGLVVLVLGIGGNLPSFSGEATELQALTAAFLYNFMQLTDWPTGSATTGVTLCAVQAGAYMLDIELLVGKNIKNSTLTIKHLIPGDSVHDCHLLFISANETPLRNQEWLKISENLPVLTVSDRAGFLDQGGMIELANDGRHLQFDINLDRAKRAGLKLSSHILQVARNVRGIE